MTGIDALVAVLLIALVAFTLWYAEWAHHLKERKSRRLVERNLWRATGRRL